jgi:hypothetical protein
LAFLVKKPWSRDDLRFYLEETGSGEVILKFDGPGGLGYSLLRIRRDGKVALYSGLEEKYAPGLSLDCTGAVWVDCEQRDE